LLLLQWRSRDFEWSQVVQVNVLLRVLVRVAIEVSLMQPNGMGEPDSGNVGSRSHTDDAGGPGRIDFQDSDVTAVGTDGDEYGTLPEQTTNRQPLLVQGLLIGTQQAVRLRDISSLDKWNTPPVVPWIIAGSCREFSTFHGGKFSEFIHLPTVREHS